MVGLGAGFFALAVLARWTSQRLGLDGGRDVWRLFIHEALPERNSTFAKLERAVTRKVVNSSTTFSSGRTYGQTTIRVELSPHDLEVIEKRAPLSLLESALQDSYVAHAKQKQWLLPVNEVVAVSVQSSPILSPGAIVVKGMLGEAYGGAETGDDQADFPHADESGPVPRTHKQASDADSDLTEPDKTVPFEVCSITLQSKSQSAAFSSDVEPIRIGRDDSSDFVVADAGVSRSHAWLSHDNTGWMVHAEPTAVNGVTVDGIRIVSPTRLGRRSKVSLSREGEFAVITDCAHRRA